MQTITNYTINTNKYGAIDVHFNENPGKTILAKLKDKGFRYFKPTQVWSTFKFKSETECLDWLVTNGIRSSNADVVEYTEMPSNDLKAISSVSNEKVVKSKPTTKKAVKQLKTSVKIVDNVATTNSNDLLDNAYEHFKAELDGKYSDKDKSEKELYLAKNGNGYAVLLAGALSKFKSTQRKDFEKNYVLYAWR